MLRQDQLTEADLRIRDALSIFQKSSTNNKYWYAVEMGQTYLDLGKVREVRAERARSLIQKRRFWSEASLYYQKALDARATGPGQLDSDGHDQAGEIRRHLAGARAALAQLGGAGITPKTRSENIFDSR